MPVINHHNQKKEGYYETCIYSIRISISFGIGAAEDADKFGDAGSNTLGHIAQRCADGLANEGREGVLKVPNLTKLGLGLAAKESCGTFPAGLDEMRKLSAVMLMQKRFHPVRIPRPVTGKLPVCRCYLIGAISQNTKIHFHRSY